jgi:hypothetical protein
VSVWKSGFVVKNIGIYIACLVFINAMKRCGCSEQITKELHQSFIVVGSSSINPAPASQCQEMSAGLLHQQENKSKF